MRRLVALMLNVAVRMTRRHAGVVLVYHSVGERRGDPKRELVPPIEASEFRRQLRHLARHYDVVPVDTLMEAVAKRRLGQRLPVALTFDDDDPNHVRYALPELRQHGTPAAFFLCGAGIDGGETSFWWQRLQRAVDAGVPLATIAALMPTHEKDPLGGSPRDIHEVAATAVRLDPAARDTMNERLLRLAGPDAPDAVLSQAGTAELAEAGFTIGFHTLRHYWLPGLNDTELARALHEGRAELARVARQPIEMIAYPHGAACPRVAEAARRAGFRLGFTARRAPVTKRSDPLLLGRFEPEPTSLGRFALAVIATALIPRRVPEWVRAAFRSDVGLPRRAARRVLSRSTRWRLLNRYGRLKARPRVGRVRIRDLEHVPISRRFGFDRGKPIDRHYIEAFLRPHAEKALRGRVLEVGDARYTEMFGAPDRIEQVDILDVSRENPDATLIADLAAGEELPSDAFDCVICTQTLPLIYDVAAAARTLHRVLKPGGTLLVTVPGISQACRQEMEMWGDYWRFTTASAKRLFEEPFGAGQVTVESYGNVLAAAGFLYGLAVEDLQPAQLDFRDGDYQLVVGVKAVKTTTA